MPPDEIHGHETLVPPTARAVGKLQTRVLELETAIIDLKAWAEDLHRTLGHTGIPEPRIAFKPKLEGYAHD